jgi:integrase
MQRGGWIDPRLSATSLALVAADWLKADATKRPGSVARDVSILSIHILPVLGNRSVGAITRADIQNLVNVWIARYASSTVIRHYACMRTLLSYAESCELIVRSPCRNIRVPEASPRRAQILDGNDLERLARRMGDYGPMVYLAAFGLRWGEIAGMRVGRLDFLRHTVTVATQRTRGQKGRMVEQDPKTKAGRRSFTVPEWMMTMLAEHLASRGVNGGDPDALVFVSPTGAPLHYSNWRRRVWLPALQTAGFADLTFHDVKHTAGTVLLAEGVDVKIAQVRLGHANPQTTLRIYAQATERADRAAAEKVGDRLRPRDERVAEPLDETGTTRPQQGA